MTTPPRKPFLPTRTDLKRLVRLNGLVLVWGMPVMLVVVLVFARNVRTAGDASAAVLVHAALFGIGLVLIRRGRPTE